MRSDVYVSYQANLVAQSAIATGSTQHSNNIHVSTRTRHHERRVSSIISCIQIWMHIAAAGLQQCLDARGVACTTFVEFPITG